MFLSSRTRRMSASPLQAEETGEGAILPTFLHLTFDDVHYAYDDGERPAVNGLSFSLAAGERVALVGPSGAGKSTVAYLLLCFVEPDRGTITVDGRSLRSLQPAAWREQVAWVPQNPHLFHGTEEGGVSHERQ